MKLAFVSVILIILSCSFKDTATIEQKFTYASLCPISYRVETTVWIRSWNGSIISLEQLQYGKYSDIDSAKAASVVQLDNAKKQLVEISDCLSENKIKVSPKTFAQQSIKAPLRYGLSAH